MLITPKQRNGSSGFTIVELLIVIVLIGILVAISLVVYSGVQTRAHNTMRTAEAQEWVKLFGMYAQLKGEYPASDRYCLGRDFPKYNGSSTGSCWDASGGGVIAYENSAIMNEIEEVTGASLPNYDRMPITENGRSRVGPVFWGDRASGVYRVKYFLQSQSGTAAEDTCPVGEKLWNATQTYSCIINMPPPG